VGIPLRLWRRRNGIPAPLVTHRPPCSAVAESIPEQRPARGMCCLIESLGISPPCQVATADQRMACTSAYRS
jgi:hypothetical protein